jgi:MSHA pilin protein MshD
MFRQRLLHAPSPQPSPTRGEGVKASFLVLTSPLVGEVERSSGEGFLRQQRGVTLIELVLSIVIVAIAASAVLGLLSFASKGSADAMVRNQAVAIAQAYLEEIRLKEFAPNGVEASRDLYNDVSDYNGLTNTGAYDQFNVAIVGLESYNVAVSVADSALGSIGSGNAKRIDVTVQNTGAGVTVVLSGYRTAY